MTEKAASGRAECPRPSAALQTQVVYSPSLIEKESSIACRRTNCWNGPKVFVTAEVNPQDSV